jgi:hypothetical protein
MHQCASPCQSSLAAVVNLDLRQTYNYHNQHNAMCIEHINCTTICGPCNTETLQ